MNDIRFYEKFTNKGRKGEASEGTIYAVCTSRIQMWQGRQAMYEAWSGRYDTPNTPITHTQVSLEHLWDHCRMISEKRVREVYPAMLDAIQREGHNAEAI